MCSCVRYSAAPDPLAPKDPDPKRSFGSNKTSLRQVPHPLLLKKPSGSGPTLHLGVSFFRVGPKPQAGFPFKFPFETLKPPNIEYHPFKPPV